MVLRVSRHRVAPAVRRKGHSQLPLTHQTGGVGDLGTDTAVVDNAPGPPFPFWLNFESRPLDFRREWPPPEPLPPVYRQWLRFLDGDFTDPWVDACRALVVVDVQSWPAASRPHMWKQPNVY